MFKFFKKQHHSPYRIGVLLLLFLCAIVAGYIGGLLSSDVTSVDSVVRPPIILEDRTRTQTPIGDSITSAVYGEVRPSIMDVYRVTARDLARPWMERALTQSTLLGYAIALTSDGWLATSIPPTADDMQSLLIIDSEHNAYRPEKSISDSATGVTYIKLAAANLKPAQIASEISPIPQDGYLVTDSDVSPQPLSILSYSLPQTTKDALQSTETLRKRFNPTTVYDWSGLPVISAQKEVLGITSARGVVPMTYISRSLRDILKTGKISRPKALLQYFDNEHLPLIPVAPQQKRAVSGATVATTHPSITIPTPTGTDRLLPGDVITAVNADTVDKQRSLSELINEYQPSDPIQLKITRANTSLTLTMVLQ
ncbi:MAG: S1C family serine protease [bacterium]|nr:S1C family serine protease [bacterium]